MLFAIGMALGGSDGVPPHPTAAGVVGDAVWSLSERTLRVDGAVVVEDVHGRVASSSGVLAMARMAREPVHTELVVIVEGVVGVREQQAEPSRVALSPDGRHVAFVSGHTGWASVYVLDLATDTTRQLTNTEVHRVKGARPLGFTPPPLDPPVFSGCSLSWTTAETSVEVQWCW